MNRYQQSEKHAEREMRALNSPSEDPTCQKLMRLFLQTHCLSGLPVRTVSQRTARYILGLQYPQDVTSACKLKPYCVYVCGPVLLGAERREKSSCHVVLVGYFDEKQEKYCIHILDVFQSSDDSSASGSLLNILQRFQLPVSSMAACHIDDERETSEIIARQVQQLNPNVLHVDGLYSLADAACNAALMTHSSPVQQLILNIYRHHCFTSNDHLKSLFAGIDGLNEPGRSLTDSCEEFCVLLQRMLGTWKDLLSYFTSCEENSDEVKHICSQLKNRKMRVTFMFLHHALAPLCAFQRHLESCEDFLLADLEQIFREASGLLRSYASSFLRPQAVIRYLKERSAAVLENSAFCLPASELSVGRAVEDFITAHEEELEGTLNDFQDECLAFYKTLTVSIAEHLPLSDGCLRSMSQLLSPHGRFKLSVKNVVDLAVQFGLCATSEDAAKLKEEFLQYQLAEEEDELKIPNKFDASSCPSLELYWSDVLKTFSPASILRQLVLSLLAVPSPSLKAQKIFARAVEDGDSCHWDDESDTDNTNDLDSSDDSLQAADVSTSPVTKRNTRNRTGSESEMSRTLKTLKPCVVLLQRVREVDLRRSGAFDGIFRFQKDRKGFAVGELVWGKVKGFSWWPGLVVSWNSRRPSALMRRVEWFGDCMYSEVHTDALLPLAAFAKCFCNNSYVGLPAYKDAIYQILELAAVRCGRTFRCSEKKDEIKFMLEWAFGGFKPTGPDGFLPSEDVSACKAESSDSSLSDCQPPGKRKYVRKKKQSGSSEKLSRELMVHEVTGKGKNIENFCLSCGTSNMEIFHPLFEGSLCFKCKENFTETLFRYDDDGCQSYCTICCAGQEVILCGNNNCCRCFCKGCLNVLVEPGTFEKLKLVDLWICYVCRPSKSHGVLKPRPDWRVRVQEFFANNSAFEFEPHRIYPSIPVHQRHPIRVVSLFDGIVTGYVVLKDLGFKVERYIGSEISGGSNAVEALNHNGKIEYVKDVRTITRKQLADWGPFDLLIGGSSCNDASMMNPAKKEGVGRLFFEYYRMLTMMRPREDDSRPFFWLFENVVAMSAHDKADICRFLECNPVMIDVVNVNPAHQARYFWGNLPSMSRPLSAGLSNDTDPQDSQEMRQTAAFNKVSPHAKSSSVKQGHSGLLAAVRNRSEDSVEMKRTLESVKHFPATAAAGDNCEEQKAVGRCWSLAVIQHLLTPLKSYFTCE